MKKKSVTGQVMGWYQVRLVNWLEATEGGWRHNRETTKMLEEINHENLKNSKLR